MTAGPQPPERSEIRFGITAIPYTIERGRRVKTVAIAVDREGVLVRAPAETPLDRLDEIVRAKARWISDRLRRFRELPPAPSERQFVSGETFLYLGRQARLSVMPAAGRPRGVRLTAGRLAVPVAETLTGRERAAAIRKQLIAWYRAHAADRLPEQVEPWRTRLGLAPAGLLIRSQEKRWASCAADGILRFNWRIIQAPVSLIDYVVAHELVHLLHRHHTPEYWATLGRVMPDYEERREALRRLGERLVW